MSEEQALIYLRHFTCVMVQLESLTVKQGIKIRFLDFMNTMKMCIRDTCGGLFLSNACLREKVIMFSAMASTKRSFCLVLNVGNPVLFELLGS